MRLRIGTSTKQGQAPAFADGREATVATARCRNGTLSFLRFDDPIGRSLLQYGEWAQLEIDFLLRLVRRADVVVDAGAYIGTHTVAFAHRVGRPGRVYAFEPSPVALKLLHANVRQNDLRNVRVLPSGLAAEETCMAIAVPDVSQRQNFGALCLDPLPSGGDTTASAGVPVMPLDRCALERCDLMKVDVEGMEFKVLLGATDTIAKHRPVVYVECNTIEAGWPSVTFMRSMDYAAYLHRSPAFNPSNYLGNRTNIFRAAHETSLLFVPRERYTALRPVLKEGPYLLTVKTLDDLARAVLETPRWRDAVPDEGPGPTMAVPARVLMAAIAERDAQIAALHASTSWRITAPLRWLAGCLRLATGRTVRHVRQGLAPRSR